MTTVPQCVTNLLKMAQIIGPEKLNLVVRSLDEGCVAGIPTETVYGLAARIDRPEGIEKIFRVKERPFFDPLIVHVASVAQAQSLVKVWPTEVDEVAKAFWPGPLTLVLPKTGDVSPWITSGLETVGIRWPKHELALEVLRKTGPLAAPSANKFGRTSPTTAAHVAAEFQQEDLLVLDGGPCEIGLESTVLGFDGDTFKIYRPGAVTEELLEGVLRQKGFTTKWVRESSVASPGHLQHHYMPTVPLVLLERDLDAELIQEIETRLAVTLKSPAELELGMEATLAARKLYEEMRQLVSLGSDLLYVVRRPEQKGGLWNAIWDRIERAATFTLR